jgi:outer membrane autotransporter protein
VINTTLASSTVYGNISNPAGATNLAAGTEVHVTVAGALTSGQAITIQKGQPGVDKAITVTGNSARYTFAGAYIGATGEITVTPIATTTTATTSSNNQDVATVLDVTAGTATGDMLAVQNKLSLLSTAGALDAAYSQLDPIVNAGATTASFNAMQGAIGTITDHLADIRRGVAPKGGGVSTGDFWKNEAVWAKGFGSYANQGTRKDISGYDASLWGAAGGMDGIVADNTRLGLSGGYSATNVDNKGEPGGTDVNSYQGTVYLGYDDPSPWYGSGGFSFAWNTYDGSRAIIFPGIDRTAKGSYDGQQYTGFLDLGYVFTQDKFEITPMVGLTYSHLNLESYTETEAGDLNLNVASQDYDLLQQMLGIKLARPYVGKDGTWTPEIHFKWLYDYIGDKVATAATFTGGGYSFSTNGAAPDQSSYNFGAGFTFYTKGNISITATYDFEMKDQYTSHTGQGVVRYAF